MVEKVVLQVEQKDGVTSIAYTLPTNHFTDSDVAFIHTYLASRFDVLSFSCKLSDDGNFVHVSFKVREFYGYKDFVNLLKSL